jgi:hypothetical protein
VEDLRRAWAVFGLRPGSSVDDLRGRYRALAKQWHPDRYARDPQGQKEAEIQMRVVNSAYERLLVAARAAADRVRPPAPGPENPSSQTMSPQRGRLSREELDQMIASMSAPSYVEMLLDDLPAGRYFRGRNPKELDLAEFLSSAISVVGLQFFLLAIVLGLNPFANPSWLVLLAPSAVLFFRKRTKRAPAGAKAPKE